MKIAAEQEPIILSLYKDGLSMKEIGLRFNVSRQPIDSVLRKFGAAKRPRNLCSRKHSLDEDFFENINSPEKAYFLGWLMADGCNSENGMISLRLHSKDKDILEILNSLLTTTYKIKVVNSKKRDYAELVLCSAKMSKDLIKLGCTPRKSLTLKFPQISHQLLYHFIRGYFDGDGSLFNRTARPREYAVSIAGSNNFCDSLRAFLEKDLNVKIYLKRQGKISVLEIFKRNDIQIFLDKIYENSGLMKLDRKYSKYQEFLSLSV